MVTPLAVPPEFRALSARLGSDPLQIQGPGGNTSFKRDGVMWIKASGTELADAETKDIFVAVDLEKARAEVDGAGDGTCRAAMLDTTSPIRPSIETTFHAMFDASVVVHTHSVATLAHVISDAGTAQALDLLKDLGVVGVPYRKPGLPLTLAIRDAVGSDTRVVLLRNHGLIVVGESVEEADRTVREVERRLAREPSFGTRQVPDLSEGWRASEGVTSLAGHEYEATSGSYWPDHVVFLGPGVASSPDKALPEQKAALVGTMPILRSDTKPIGDVMLQCLAAVFARQDAAWKPVPIGREAEAELMNWDAEEYRQKLTGRS